MNGWLHLGNSVHFLHQHDGLLWVKSFFEGAIVVLDLVHGRVHGRPFRPSENAWGQSWSLGFGDALLHQEGERLLCLSTDGVRWEHPGFLIDADARHVLVALDPHSLAVLDTQGRELCRLPTDLDENTGDPTAQLLPLAIDGHDVVTTLGGVFLRRTFSGQVVEERPIDARARVRRVLDGLVTVQHVQSSTGPSTLLEGAIEAEVRGTLTAIAGSEERWVALVEFPDARTEAVFWTEGTIDRVPIDTDLSVVLADARTRMVGGGSACVWRAAGRLRSLTTTEQFTQWTLWDGFVVALLDEVLTPVHSGELSRCPIGTQHRVEGFVREPAEGGEDMVLFGYQGDPPMVLPPDWERPEENRVGGPPTDPALCAGAPAQLELTEAPFGVVLDGWSADGQTWHRPTRRTLDVRDGPPAVQDARARTRTLEQLFSLGFCEEPLWRFLQAGEAPLGLCACTGGSADPFLVPFARGPREELYAVARWPLDRQWGVAVTEPDEPRPRWLCDSVHAFFRAVQQQRMPEPTPSPDWFQLAHARDELTLVEVQRIEDAIERERRLVHTPWHWGAPGYAGLVPLGIAVVGEPAKSFTERIGWQRRRVAEAYAAGDRSEHALDGFFAELAAGGPLLERFSAQDLHLMGPQVGGRVPLDDDPSGEPAALQVGPFFLPVPGMHAIFDRIALFVWPPEGVVLVRLGRPLEPGAPLYLSSDPVRDLARVPDLLHDHTCPAPRWFQELFGEAEPTDALRAAFATYLQEAASPDSVSRLRAAFVERGWTWHAAALAEVHTDDL